MAYAVGHFIIVALDRKAKRLTLTLKDTNNKFIATYGFNETDFEKVEVHTTEQLIFLEIEIDGLKIKRKIYMDLK